MSYTVRFRYPPGEARMGRIITTVTIRSFMDPAREVRTEALVDTGAYCLTVPATWKERFEPLPLSRSVQVTTADQRVLDAEIGGPLMIRINGFDAIAGEVLFLPQEIDEDGFEVLIGYITLEQAALAVDMVGHRLIKLPNVDLKTARAA